MFIKDFAKIALLSSSLYSKGTVNARPSETVLVEIEGESGEYEEHMKHWTPEI